MEISSYLSEKQKKRRKRRAYFSIAITVVVVCLVFSGVLWIFTHVPLFKIRNIVVTGDDQVASSDVIAVLQSDALRNHGLVRSLMGIDNMLVWPDSFSSSDLALLPEVSNAVIDKDYFTRTITVNITERAPAGIWCFMPKLNAAGNPAGDESCYWFDAGGVLFKRGFDTEGSSLFAIHDYSQADPGLGGKILPDEFVANMLSVVSTVRQSGISISEIALRDISLEEIDVTTYNGPDIYFSLRFPSDEDLPVMEDLMLRNNFAKLQYVDFRVENRAYYK